MALGSSTYWEIPRLDTYAEAKKHYDRVVPIRGDAHSTRPCGRRDQKWFSIWMVGSDVHVGYGSSDKRESLISYQQAGTITVHKRNRHASASTNERRYRLLGIEFRTHQYDTWVRCDWYDGGARRAGWLPLNCNGERAWNPPAGPAKSVFVQDGEGKLVYLNYKYPVTHNPNKVRLEEAMAPFAGFFKFHRAMHKLQGGKHLTFEPGTVAHYFGWADRKDYRGRETTNSPPNIHWGLDVTGMREQFFAWAASGDHDNLMRAAITIGRNDDAREAVKKLLLQTRSDALLEPTIKTEGRLVRDRCRMYLR